VDDTFRWVRGTWETRRPKEPSKDERAPLTGRTDPRSSRRVVLPLSSSEPLLSLAVRARRDGGPFACLYTSAPPAEAFVPIVTPRRVTPFRRPRGFSPLESSTRRDHSLTCATGPPDHAAVFGFAVESARAFDCRRSLPGADGPKRRWSLARLVEWTWRLPSRPPAAAP
jgi:hypothetical protein